MASDAVAETESQSLQMTAFILNEAKDRAEEISAKALQDFNVEKEKIVKQLKEKILQDQDRKLKQQDTQNAIARSTAINKSRLEKIKARQEMIGKVHEDAKAALEAEMKSESKAGPFITKLIVQGLLMLLEDEVQVRCRAGDDKLVEKCLADAAKQYSEIVKRETQADKTVKLTLDKSEKLGLQGRACLGGVVLACHGGAITIDNTIDSRLGLVLEQSKPMIRSLLFSK